MCNPGKASDNDNLFDHEKTVMGHFIDNAKTYTQLSTGALVIPYDERIFGDLAPDELLNFIKLPRPLNKTICKVIPESPAILVSTRPRGSHAPQMDYISNAALYGRKYPPSNVKLNHQAVKTSIFHLEKQTEAIKNGELSLLNAVSIALDIEKSMIDKKFFQIFDLSDTRLERTRAGLEKETTKHRQKLEMLFGELSDNYSRLEAEGSRFHF